MERILLDHGSGGSASHRLINEYILKYFSNPLLEKLDDGAVVNISKNRIAISTDGYTVDPLFFPGGDIGSLSIHGTINDLSMMGATPLYLTCGLIIEESFPFETLDKILASMAKAAKEANVFIVTGDTKVVPKGAADKIFITTTGIGILETEHTLSGNLAKPGDAVLINGFIGDHGLTVMSNRNNINLNVKSDAASLNFITKALLDEIPEIHVFRDPTRGGLATTLNEIAKQSNVEINLLEDNIPIHSEVNAGCSILGFDPLYLANEGKFLCILPQKYANQALAIMRANPLGIDCQQIGTVNEGKARVIMETTIGGKRLLSMLEGEQLPRIC